MPADRRVEWTAIAQVRLRDGRIAGEWVERDMIAQVATATLRST